ncbi:MAG: hypothetical protein CMK07_00405 [Ponticaulis sp.]|nr:hypothetical protein [Ponticaulis sp.]
MRCVVLSLMLSLAGVEMASAQEFKAEQIAEVVTLKVAENGETEEVLTPAEMVKPGEIVRYTIAWENTLESEIEDMVLEIPLPPQMTYRPGSGASDGVEMLFSANGGESYSALSGLLVLEEDQSRLAEPQDITHLKWVFSEPLAPGAQGELSYDAVLK